jgi:hypothetical protein
MNLADHFDTTSLRWAALAVEKAQEQFPQICPNGLSWYYQDKPEIWTDSDYAMVCLCRLYFFRAEPIKTPSTGSYGLKHRIEQHFTINGSQSYVHNGSCIVAAMAMDYPIKTHWQDRLTCRIGISKRSVSELKTHTEELTEHPLRCH